MSHFSKKINQLALGAVSQADALELRLKLADVQKLERLIHRTKRTAEFAHKPTKLARRPKIVPPKPEFCRYCRMRLPHTDKAAISFHFYELQRRKPQQAAIRRWREIGFDTLGLRSGVVRRAKAVEIRLQMFRELAPHAYAVLGREAVRGIILKFLDKQGWLRHQEDFSRLVKRRYSHI